MSDSFERYSAAWYRDHLLEEGVVDEIRFGPYPERGAPASHISIRWEAGATFGAARLSLLSPDWPLLYKYRELLQELASASNRALTPDDVVEVLLGHGFVDRTERQDAGPLFDPLGVS